MGPLTTARAAIAGALTMLFGVWVVVRVTEPEPLPVEQLLGTGVVLLIIVLLLLGIDPRRKGGDEG